MKSKSLIEKQLKRKNNPDLVETIFSCKKNNSWLEVGSLLSKPRRKRINLNLNEIDKQSKENENVLVPGKVLSLGIITKKIKVIALSFSERAKEKLLKANCEISNILEEIKKNPNAKEIKILKNK